MSREVVILGPTGNIGSSFARLLMGKNISFRTGNRQDFDYLKPQTYRPLLKGATDLLLLVPMSENLVEVTAALVASAEKEKIERIVKISALGADAQSPSRILKLHALADEVVARSPISSVSLRASAFMQNLVQFYAKGISFKNALTVPTGDSRVSFVDAQDIAETAFEAFLKPERFRQSLDVTGPEAFSFSEVAALLSKILNREIQHFSPEVAAFRAYLGGLGVPPWNVESLIELYASYRSGLAAQVNSDLPGILGRPLTTLESFLDKNKNNWKLGGGQ